MAALQELSTNKIKLFQLFLKNRAFVDLVTNRDDVPLPAMSLQYTQVFPYPKIDFTITEAKTYVCFEVNVPAVSTSVIKDVQLAVYIITHDELMKTELGTRIDLLASCVDSLLNGSVNFGIGKVELKTVDSFNPAKNFYGRRLVYKVQDFNRICDKI